MKARSPFFLFLLFFSAVSLASEPLLLPDLEGRNHKLSDYRGKWVVVNYWATWCPPCLKEIPDLVRFHEKYKDQDAVVIGVNFETISLDKLRGFVKELDINYPVLLEEPGPNGQFGYIPGLPITYLISPEGDLVAKQVGLVTDELLEEVIAYQREKRSAM